MQSRSWSFLIAVVFLNLFSFSIFASVEDLKELFKENFVELYEPRFCGKNILRLVDEAKKRNIDIDDAKLVNIENSGISVFGMLNVELARGEGPFDPNYAETGHKYLPGERNWYFHVVLEMDGIIFDFDFTNDPKPLTKKEYFELMFLQEKKVSEGGSFFVGREEKLNDYTIELIKVSDARAARENRVKPVPVFKGNLKKYLE